MINNADSTLSFVSKAAGQLLSMGPSIVASYAAMYCTQGLNIYSQAGRSSLGFFNATGGKIDYCFQHDDNNFSIYTYPDSGSGFTALSLNRATGQIAFNGRPSFNGSTPWDSANFNPATKANAATTLAGYGITDGATKTDLSTKWDTGTYPPAQYIKLGQSIANSTNPHFGSGATPALSNIPGDTGPVWFTNEGNPGASAAVVFHRMGSYAAYFGLDTDNQFKVGGWSMGQSYLLWHGGNCDLVGSVSYFIMNGPPNGFIKANGAAISRTAYANLFAKVGTMYGAGDGSTTFNVPDLRGEFVRGFDDARGVDVNRVFGSNQAQDIQPHTHTVYSSGNNTSYGYQGTGSGPGVYVATSSAGVTETRPRNVALLACIKY
ncbi:tail fiber protein [Pseudomonas lurida]|nr:tail fiber protein [Pseudomonas lurida]